MDEQLSLTVAIRDFLFDKSSSGRSLHTIADYRNYLEAFDQYVGDRDLVMVTSHDIAAFLNYMQHEYRVRRAGVPTNKQISVKTLSNIQSILTVFWNWAGTKHQIPNPCAFERAKPTMKPIDPLTEEDVAKILAVIDKPFIAHRKGHRSYEYSRKTRKRDRAVIFTLLDTGARASEICDAKLRDLDIDSGRLKVTGKGTKTRFVYLGVKGKNAVWQYLLERFPRGKFDPDQFLIMDEMGRYPMNRDSLRHMLIRIGEQAGVPNPHPHRWRHTFALEYLRNGGDTFTLQQLLGHTTLDMVLRYVKLAQGDMERVHKRANPSDNWRIR
jgi:integrase/recombinase XerD